MLDTCPSTVAGAQAESPPDTTLVECPSGELLLDILSQEVLLLATHSPLVDSSSLLEEDVSDALRPPQGDMMLPRPMLLETAHGPALHHSSSSTRQAGSLTLRL